MSQKKAHIIPNIADYSRHGRWWDPEEESCRALCGVKLVRFRDDERYFLREIARHRMQLGYPDAWCRNCLRILASEASAGSGAGCRPAGRPTCG